MFSLTIILFLFANIFLFIGIFFDKITVPRQLTKSFSFMTVDFRKAVYVFAWNFEHHPDEKFYASVDSRDDLNICLPNIIEELLYAVRDSFVAKQEA